MIKMNKKFEIIPIDKIIVLGWVIRNDIKSDAYSDNSKEEKAIKWQ